MAPSCCDDDYKLGEKKYETSGEQSHTDGRGPGKVEVVTPIERDERKTAKEQDGAGPSPKTCGDFAVTFVLGPANFAHRLDGETMTIIDAAAKCWDELDLPGCVFFRLG